MPTLVDVFNSDAFGLVEMVAALEKMPYAPGLISSLGMFTSEPVNDKTIVIEEKDGVLAVLPYKERGDHPTTIGETRGISRPIMIPHVPAESNIYPGEVVGVREFGTGMEYVNIESVRDKKLEQHARHFDVTEEWHRLCALRGILLQNDGTTTVQNIFTFFGVTAVAAIDFDLAAATTAAFQADCNLVHRTIAQELTIAPWTMGIVGAICGDTFFDELIVRTDVQTAMVEYEANLARRGAAGADPLAFRRENHVYRQFEYQNILWMNYRGNNNLISNWIAAGSAHFFPIGVPGLFRTWYAPSEKYLDTVGTLGRPRFTRAFMEPDQTKINIYSEMNDLQLCMQPRVLLTGTNT
jgi:hypothetical protein